MNMCDISSLPSDTVLLIKLLYNKTQRLRRHFALNMFLAFLILSINQLVYLGDTSLPLCVVSAYLHQFFFLTAFNFMTIISVDTAISAIALRVSSSRDKRKFLLTIHGQQQST